MFKLDFQFGSVRFQSVRDPSRYTRVQSWPWSQEHVHILVDKWPDIDLPHSRVIRKAHAVFFTPTFLV